MTPLYVKLARAGDTLPLPERPGELFPAEGRMVDGDDPFWIGCLADGSVVPAPEPVSSPPAQTKSTAV